MSGAEIRINGAAYPLRVTLGALAAMEERFGVGDLEALGARLSRLGAGDLLVALHALIEGGGGQLSLDLLKASPIDFHAASAAVIAAFAALRESDPPGKPKAAGPAASKTGSFTE